MIENLLIYAMICLVLYVIFSVEKNDDVTRIINNNYAEYRKSLIVGDDDE